MAVHHSALLHIAIAQAYLKLENTDEIIALASAAQKLSRKYCMVVACFDYFGFDYSSSASGSTQEAAPHVSELLCYVEGD